VGIEANNITGLKNRNQGVGKLSLSDSDYVLRVKDAEDVKKNTHDITGQDNKYAEELARVKAEARKEIEAELLSSGFLDKLKADIKSEMAESNKKVSNTSGGK
jgi:hypothetical protein